ncbi:MAG: polyprenyl synthetase family protein [Planctomycetota bacterium]|nr:polyprenyl synthetase family protein [Planctomycetota bacterium]
MSKTAAKTSSQPKGDDKASLTEPVVAVEAFMTDFLDRRPLPSNLREAIRYSLFGPGKRMRPILVIRSAEAVGGQASTALAPAAAIEMIHCFSLVHDDLPAMDDDDLRRGRPTLHKATNEAMAILAGDAMLGLAFELLFAKLPPALAATIAHELAIGNNDMIAGQVHDTLPDFDVAVPPIERLRTIHKNKTGALIRASCRMGAICAGATPGQLEAITTYADAIGLMFQVVDDLLDVTQTTEHLGKATNKDADKGKLTYPGLLGIEASKGEVTRLQRESHAALDKLGGPAERTRPLRELCDYMAVRSK